MATPPAVPPTTDPTKGTRARSYPLLNTESEFTNGKRTSFRIDVERLRREYLTAPEREWADFVHRAGYPLRTPAEVPWRTWQREKKHVLAWQQVREEVEELGSANGPRNLVTAMRAARTIPEVAEAVVGIVRHMTVQALRDIEADQRDAPQWANNHIPPNARRFQMEPHDMATLAGALEVSRKTLFECLGLESALGLEPERWAALADQHLTRYERETEPLPEPEKKRKRRTAANGPETPNSSPETPTGVQIEVLGVREGVDSRELIRQAFEKYFDRPVKQAEG